MVWLNLRGRDLMTLQRLVEEHNISGLERFLSAKLGRKVRVWDAEIKNNTIIIYLGRSI